MTLTSGTRLGPYEIVAPIGAGGMGEVYRARDTRLDRTVAVKIAAEQFSERFDREARAVAALNHPNICTLHDVGPNYLVMEYVEGPTLAERIRTGALPLEEALAIARQIAEALEAAHEKGIVHRDLKPANIKLTGEGKVKVLDFGLAKALETDGAAADPASSPTLTLNATRAGVILGTAAYMSPEQARGQPVDRRADIWAFGVVLLEMLTGRATFAGETVSDTLASVLKTDPEWSALPVNTPAPIRRLLRRCLERDRRKRLRDIADARLELDEAPEAPVVTTTPPRRRVWLPWAIAGLLLFSTAWFALIPARRLPEPSIQVSIPPPEKAVFAPLRLSTGGMAISPDGRSLAFLATQDGKTLLWVRRLDSLASQPLPRTENALRPFWSADSRFIGFFAEGKIKKIEVAGGPPQVVCDANAFRGGTWNREGAIVFSGTGRILYRVPAAGGRPVPLTKLDSSIQESSHEWPWFLPDGRNILYSSMRTGQDSLRITSLDRPDQHVELTRSDFNGLYAPSTEGGLWSGRGGWLLFLRDTTLFAQKLNVAARRLEGEAVPISENVGSARNLGFASITVSENGVLVYGHEMGQMTRLVWFTRDGRRSPAVRAPGSYSMPRISPDGSRLALSLADPQTGNMDIWLIDLARDMRTRFTSDPATDVFPLWSPDGRQVAFGSTRKGTPGLFLKAANGVGEEQSINVGNAGQAAYDWSHDGRYIVYLTVAAGTGPDLWVLDLKGKKSAPFIATQFNESQGQFSPDGRWIAYSSDESGRYEVYVRSFQGPTVRLQISNDGGAQPRWRGDGKELFYLTPDGKMMAVAVRPAGAGLERDPPRVLFESRALAGNVGSGPQGFLYDVTRDGQRFLAIEPAEGGQTETLTLMTNWQAGLRK